MILIIYKSFIYYNTQPFHYLGEMLVRKQGNSIIKY